MDIDHIFIFSDNCGDEADELGEFGLTEGSSRIHPGQGTQNRKFYFENFFLEILWVIDETEIHQTPTLETHLGQRANFNQNGASRFGLCLPNTEETDALFRKAQIYSPSYFPPEMAIDILPNTHNPKLPWTFRLPYRGGKHETTEPTKHPNNIQALTKVEFGISAWDLTADYLSHFAEEEKILFKQSAALTLHLEFDFGKQRKVYQNERLSLSITY